MVKGMTIVFILYLALIASTAANASTCIKKDEVHQKIGKLFAEAVKLAMTETECEVGSEDNPADSCADVVKQQPDAPPGYYWIKASNGSAIKVYCDGEWTRVAFLNMTDPTHECPQPWKEISEPVRTCTKKYRTYHCGSVVYPTHGLQYSTVRGRIVAYQHGRTYAFTYYKQNQATATIDTHYLDGISLTYGTPREHIWSFAASLCENCQCCSSGGTPPWVGEDYFCESGTPDVPRPPFPDDLFFEEDVLWDGQGCGAGEDACCKYNNPPWFTKVLKAETDADIEVRSCGTINSTQDVPVEVIEIYVK